jgi:hypothetical protein
LPILKNEKRIKKARIGRSHGDEGFETNQIGSEEMELNISLVLEKIENFTQRYPYIVPHCLKLIINHTLDKWKLFDMFNGGFHVGT